MIQNPSAQRSRPRAAARPGPDRLRIRHAPGTPAGAQASPAPTRAARSPPSAPWTPSPPCCPPTSESPARCGSAAPSGSPPGAYFPEGPRQAARRAGHRHRRRSGQGAWRPAGPAGRLLRRRRSAALGSGKYDVGTGSFGVTAQRRRTVDFVTYINDGQGFAVSKDTTASKKQVTTCPSSAGKNIGVGAGTTFEATLNARKAMCAEAGRKPYEVKVYSENGATLTGLQQGRIDVIMSTINGLRYQASATRGADYVPRRVPPPRRRLRA